MWGALSDERTGMSFTIAAGPRQRSHSGVRNHILLSQIRDYPFRRLLRLAGLRWRYSTLPPHRQLRNLATSHREHSFYCCVVAGTCIQSRCLAMVMLSRA
jgi:hypothetical protein